jgi:hypothetical protein
MKKLFLPLILIILLPMINFAQNFQVMPYAGYLLSGNVYFYEGKINVDDAFVYGGSLIIPDIKYSTDLEFSYFRSDSKATFYPNHGFDLDEQTLTMATNYLQLGAIKKMPVNEKVFPFFSLSAGATWFSSPDFSAVWRFSVTMGGGLEFFVTDRIGIMLRARLLLPMNFSGVGGWCGIGTGGSGCGLSVNSYSVVTQGDFTGGLIFKLGK